MLTIADKTFHSRLFTGTGKFGSSQLMEEAIVESGSELVTVALRRVDVGGRAGGAGQAGKAGHGAAEGGFAQSRDCGNVEGEHGDEETEGRKV